MTALRPGVADFEPFLLERTMSLHEQEVAINLSESGVLPMTLGELAGLADGALDELLGVRLGYPHADGIPAVREAVAALHPGATATDVLVTVGAAEANYLALRSLLGPGERLVVMRPNYLQVEGIARNHGAAVAHLPLDPERGWAPRLELLDELVTEGTRLVAVCHPNNPTGRLLREEEIAAIVAAAERVGAWILSDEVYRGSEREGREAATFWGRTERVVVTGSTSKAYGLPGLRLGWAVAPEDALVELWKRHEYLAIAAATPSNLLAALALAPDVRPRILERTRRLVNEGLAVLRDWGRAQADRATVLVPDASAVALVRYAADVPSFELAERLRKEHDVLVAAGAHLGAEGCLRIGFGGRREALDEGLARLATLLGNA